MSLETLKKVSPQVLKEKLPKHFVAFTKRLNSHGLLHGVTKEEDKVLAAENKDNGGIGLSWIFHKTTSTVLLMFRLDRTASFSCQMAMFTLLVGQTLLLVFVTMSSMQVPVIRLRNLMVDANMMLLLI
jgi:hypothetical protein